MDRLDKADYIISLLERIAWKLSPGMLELEDFRAKVLKPDAHTRSTIQGKNHQDRQEDQVGVQGQPGGGSQEPTHGGNSHSRRVRKGQKWWKA